MFLSRFLTCSMGGVVLMALANPATAAISTVAFYNLGEDDGAVAGNAITGTTAVAGPNLVADGTPTYSASGAGGSSSLSAAFDKNGYLEASTPAAIDLGASNWGMEGWVNTADINNGGWAFTNGSMYMGQYAGLWHFHVTGLGNIATAAIDQNQVNTWVHMAVVDQDGVKTAYLDGAALTSTNQGVAFNFPFAIGARGVDGVETWDGLVDAVHLFTFESGQFSEGDLGRTYMEIPEPASMALMGMGALLVLRRRRA